ncbi:hypothetical protein Tco_0154138 [Tanacetum coccineum]
MCILIVPQQNTGFILDSDMEGKNEESYKFPIAVQQSFNSLWSQDVRVISDSALAVIGGLRFTIFWTLGIRWVERSAMHTKAWV